MDINEEEEIKKEFQLERVILFTDAVFAIILTIMVLDLKLPEGLRTATDEHTKDAFKELILKFVGYFITFGLVSRFWVAHLKLFRFLKDYDSKLLVLNLLFLCTITLFPFAVSSITGKVNSESHAFNWVWTIYVFVIYSTVFMQSLISRYLLKNREKLCVSTSQLEINFKWKVTRINLYLIPVLIAIIFSFNFFHLPYYFPVYTVAIYGMIMARINKAYYPEENKGPLIMQLFKHIKSKRIKKHAPAHKIESE